MHMYKSDDDDDDDEERENFKEKIKLRFGSVVKLGLCTIKFSDAK